jgi:hypothetical protein
MAMDGEEIHRVAGSTQPTNPPGQRARKEFSMMSPSGAMTLTPTATSSAVLFNEGLDPGVHVFIDDQPEQTATVCSVEGDAAFANIRFERNGAHLRVASWRLSLLSLQGSGALH